MFRLIRKLREVARNNQGVAAVEFALTFPALVVATLVIFDIGYAVFTYSVMSSAAADGAREGSVWAEGVEYDPDIDAYVYDFTDPQLNDVETFTEGRLSGVGNTSVNADIEDRAEGPTLVVTVSHRHRFFVTALLGIDGVSMRAESEMLLL